MISSDASGPQAPATATAVPHVRGAAPGKRRAIIVGASSGIGAALLRRLAIEGYRVAGLARRGEELAAIAAECAENARQAGGQVLTRVHDVTDTEAVPALFEELVRELGGLDLFVYAAGIMPAAGRNEYDTEKDLAQVAVNLGGCIAWGNEVARLYETQREGTLVGISSIAGDRGRKGNPVYGTTKAAMATYLESLRNRLGGVGVRVVTVKPGFIATPMTEGLEGLFWVISADQAARTILRVARGRFWQTRYVPLRWMAVGMVLKLIPSFVFRKLDI